MPVRLDCETRAEPVPFPVRQLPSPNHNARPPTAAIDAVIIHGISLPPGQYGGPWIADLFLNRLDNQAHPAFAQLRGLRVSSHFLLRRDGELIQFVPLQRRAWHAGRSSLAGRDDCNDYSIGIELEGCDDQAYTEAQYQRLGPLLGWLMQRWGQICSERIVGHEHIAPGRKTDPGPAFDWPRLRAMLPCNKILDSSVENP